MRKNGGRKYFRQAGMAGKCHTPLESPSLPGNATAPPPGSEGHPAFGFGLAPQSTEESFPSSVFATAGKEQEPLVPREEPIVYREQGNLVSGSEGNSLTYKNRRDVLPPVPNTANEAV